MQSLNIFLTKQYIFCHSSDFTPQKSLLELSNTDALEAFSNYLSDLKVPKNTNINVILDQSFLKYYYFKLPPVNSRKINRILEFELEDTLLSKTEEYYYDYYARTDKESCSETGVYIMEKEFLNNLTQVCKHHNLSLHWILSLNNLMDLEFRDTYSLGNEIIISLEANISRIFVYKNGFLIGDSMALPAETIDGQLSQLFLDAINQKIAEILLQENDDFNISISGNTSSIIAVNDQELQFTENSSNNTLSIAASPNLISPIRLSHSHRVNLLKSNLLFIQEIKKHIKALTISGIILGVCLIMFICSTVYSTIQNAQQYKELDHLYTKTIQKYLKKGTAKSAALHTLKKKVKELKIQKNENRKFSKREYKVSQQLTQLSSIKKKISSLHLGRFTLKEQLIRIQGHVNSESDFDILREELNTLYPAKTYNIKSNQKSLGNDTVQFTINIRIK